MTPEHQTRLGAFFETFESSIADVAVALEKTEVADKLSAIETLLSSIESALADISEGVGKPIDFKPVVEALRGLHLKAGDVSLPAPVIHNHVKVEPAAVTVEAVMPQVPAPVVHIMPVPEQKGATWEIRMPGIGYNAPERVMTITRKG